MSGWLWTASLADEPIDKATSELLPAGAEDIALNLEICDQIRSKTIPAKDATRVLKRRLNHKNPNVQLLTLGLTDICIKNGGDHFLTEIAARDFMDNLTSLLKSPGLNIDVKNKILRYVQNWALAFEGRSNLSYVGTVYKELQSEGFTFPPKDLAATSSAMVDTSTAPEWSDSEWCMRCRDAFTFTNRKHHCRNCGQVYDQKCSAKTLALPHFGIAQEVRVCDICYPKLTKNRTKSHSVDATTKPSRHRAARELEDSELQRAIQLSLAEINAATGSSHARPGYVPSYQTPPQTWRPSEPPLVDRGTRPAAADEEEDPELRAAIEASLRESGAPRPSAPLSYDNPRQEASPHSYANGAYGYNHAQPYGHSQSYPPNAVSEQQPSLPSAPALPNYDLEDLESDAVLTFNRTVSQIAAQNRPDVARYPAVNELYHKAAGLAPKADASMADASRKEALLGDMHAKLSQAVKLYDQLLTQQVQNQNRQQQQAQASASMYAPPPAPTMAPPMPPYQQPQMTGYQQPQMTGYAQQYAQWAPSAPIAAPPPPMSPVYQSQQQQQQYQPPMMSPPVSYAQSQPQSMYAPAPAQEASSSHMVYAQPQPVPLAAPPAPSAHFVPSAPSAPPASEPSSLISSAASIPQIMSPPPSSHTPAFSNPQYQYQDHAAAVQQQQQQQYEQQYQPPPPQQQQQQYEQQYQQQPQQQPQYAPPAAPVQLPAFPSAPTTAPIPAFAYAPEPAPAPRQEAALIEL